MGIIMMFVFLVAVIIPLFAIPGSTEEKRKKLRYSDNENIIGLAYAVTTPLFILVSAVWLKRTFWPPTSPRFEAMFTDLDWDRTVFVWVSYLFSSLAFFLIRRIKARKPNKDS